MFLPRCRWLLYSALCLTFLVSPVAGQDTDEPEVVSPGINSGLVSSLGFRNIGPALMSGRIIDIAVDPVRRSTWYVAAASGGVWKTENAGVTWRPIFDNYGSFSIGSIALDPTTACQRVAAILNATGRSQAAWDYWTTPLANTPNESSAIQHSSTGHTNGTPSNNSWKQKTCGREKNEENLCDAR